ncbi:nucleoside phosphorylase [Mesonia maritima]|uniref:Uridine phosphorylase n=1 Tax=Mesonia maritima TaxID=1793873 RepID=A0ABU1K986_9FLAO|nr:nucleoside phosphorylase [Mesonia maritima]MDR6301617.1 uridine phosphorylase [Mesonia maritima]
MKIKESELILNPDGSVYHLQLHPENIAETIITVGDPDRVSTVTNFFESIEFSTQKREFHTQTGYYKNKRITVISTGIGTDNIDIVLNELDALANIDLKTRTVKNELSSLDIIRIGTSGSLQENIPVDSFVASKKAVGFDSLLHYYKSEKFQDNEFSSAIHNHLSNERLAKPYVINSDDNLFDLFSNNEKIHAGITATNVGFYAPQGRVLRVKLSDEKFVDKLQSFNYQNQQITNLEMETSGIYGLSKIFGHRALSLNAIIANRATGEFSKKGKELIEELIELTLNKLV